MTLRALSGLATLNLAYTVVGLALLWSFGALRTWNAVARLVGLGYLVGLAAFGVLWTTLLVLGVPFDGMTIVVSLVALAAAGAAVARFRGLTIDHGPPRGPATWTVLVAAAGVAVAGVFLESLFRSARLQGLQAYDAWAFWVPKGKAIYFFHGLDEHVFTTTPNSMYPPLQPIVDATAFHAMGGPDAATLHVQFWFLIVGAVGAVVGLLHRHVPAWLLWPPVLLVLVVPRFSVLMLAPLADILVDILVVVAALLVALWLRDAAGWRLAATALALQGTPRSLACG